MPAPKAGFSFTAGAMLRREVRRYLQRCAANSSLRFTEDKGFLNSQFSVSGDQADVYNCSGLLRQWAAKLEHA